MSYSLHRAFSALPASGAYDTSSEAFRIDRGSPRLAIVLKYTADPGATNGRPCFRLRWSLALPDSNGDVTLTSAYETVRLAATTPDNVDAPVTELRARFECDGLTDGDAAVDVRTVDIPPGAGLVTVEPAELGDTSNPGQLAVWLGRA